MNRNREDRLREKVFFREEADSKCLRQVARVATRRLELVFFRPGAPPAKSEIARNWTAVSSSPCRRYLESFRDLRHIGRDRDIDNGR